MACNGRLDVVVTRSLLSDYSEPVKVIVVLVGSESLNQAEFPSLHPVENRS